MAKKCEGCHFWRKFDAVSYACHYGLDMGEPKDCRASNCNKRMTESEYIQTRKADIYSKVYRQYCYGITETAIARNMKLPPNTIKKIIREMKKQNETPQN